MKILQGASVLYSTRAVTLCHRSEGNRRPGTWRSSYWKKQGRFVFGFVVRVQLQSSGIKYHLVSRSFYILSGNIILTNFHCMFSCPNFSCHLSVTCVL